jgi:hypothetical protein
MLTLHKPEGTRRVGRLDVRWLDSVEECFKTMDFRNWKVTESGPTDSNRKRGQSPSWTVALAAAEVEEEEEEEEGGGGGGGGKGGEEEEGEENLLLNIYLHCSS